MRTVVGVDPGCRETGIVVRTGETVDYACLVISDEEGIPTHAYIDEVVETVRELVVEDRLLAVEGLVVPHGRRPDGEAGIMNVKGILGTAAVYGAIVGCFPEAIVVPPERHGSAPLAVYPHSLVGPRETKGKGKYRHVRSAFDIAGAVWEQVASL